MDNQRKCKITAALHKCSAADFNDNFLQEISIDELIIIINSSRDNSTAFRAAWALEHLLLQHRELFTTYKDEVVYLFYNSTNWSVLRSISKLIIALLKKPLRYVFYISEEVSGRLVDKAFQLLEDKDCAIAVRSNAYEIAYILGMDEPILLQELKIYILLDLERNSTPALLSRGTKILKKIRTNI